MTWLRDIFSLLGFMSLIGVQATVTSQRMFEKPVRVSTQGQLHPKSYGILRVSSLLSIH